MNLQHRLSLIKQVQSNKDGHKPNIFDRKSLVNATCRQIIEECELEQRVDQTIAALRYATSDLIGFAADDRIAGYVAANRVEIQMSLKRLELLCSNLVTREAAE